MLNTNVIAELIAEIKAEFDPKGFREAETAHERFGRAVMDTMKRAGVVVAAAFAAAAVASVKMAGDFEASMTKITTLVGISEEQVSQWSDALLRMAPEVGRGPLELADALFVVTSAGQRGSEALAIVEQAAKASALGLGETATIARAVTAAVNAYGSEALSAGKATDILTAIVREGNLEAESLAPTLGRVIGIASQLGVSFEEVGANIATFTRLGVNSEEAVTALRGTLSALLSPSKGAAKALDSVGLSAAQLRRQLREKGLQSVLMTLISTFEGNTEALADVIPNVRALSGVMGTAGRQGQAYADVLQSIQQSLGLVDSEFVKLEDTLDFQIDKLQATGEAAAIAFGEAMLPAVTEATKGLNLLTLHLQSQTAPAVRQFFDLVRIGVGQVSTLSTTVEAMGKTLFGFGTRDLGAVRDRLDEIVARTERLKRQEEAYAAIAASAAADRAEAQRQEEEATDNATAALGEQRKELAKIVDNWESIGHAVKDFSDELEEINKADFLELAVIEKMEVTISKMVTRGLDGVPRLGETFKDLGDAIKDVEKDLVDLDGNALVPLMLDVDTFAGKLGAGFDTAAGFVRDFAGTAENILATAGGPWGLALAGALNLAEAFGLDLNRILNDAFSEFGEWVGGLFSGGSGSIGGQLATNTLDELTKFLDDLQVAIAGGLSVLSPLVNDAISAINDKIGEGLAEIDRLAQAHADIGKEFDANAEKLRFLQDLYIELSGRDIPGLGNTLTILRYLIEQLQAATGDAAAGAEAAATGTRAFADSLIHVQEATEDATRTVAGMVRNWRGMIEGGGTVLGGEPGTFGGLQEGFTVFELIEAHLENMAGLAAALGDPFSFIAESIKDLREHIRRLWDEGFRPGDKIMDDLIKQLALYNIQLEKQTKGFRGLGDVLDEVSEADRIMEEYREALARLSREYSVGGTEADHLRDKMASAEAAMEALRSAVGDQALSAEEAAAAYALLDQYLEEFRARLQEISEVPPPAPPEEGGSGSGSGGGGTSVVLDVEELEIGEIILRDVEVSIDRRSLEGLRVGLVRPFSDWLLEIRNHTGMAVGITPLPLPLGVGSGPTGAGRRPTEIILRDNRFGEIATGYMRGKL